LGSFPKKTTFWDNGSDARRYIMQLLLVSPNQRCQSTDRNSQHWCMYLCILRARVQPTLDTYAEAFL